MIERIGPVGPLVLRVKHETGIVSYWNWDTINRFQRDAEVGGFFFKDGSFHRLSQAECQQVQEQLDMLIDPPMIRYFPDDGPGPLPGDVWGKALRGDGLQKGSR